MASQRKQKTQPSSEDETLLLSEEEQWRLVNESGILKTLPQTVNEGSSHEEDSTLADEIFNSALLIIPFSFLLLLMEM